MHIYDTPLRGGIDLIRVSFCFRWHSRQMVGTYNSQLSLTIKNYVILNHLTD